MGKRKLILLTSQYPYGTGESFLETEIHYLSKAFDRIIVLPLDAKDLSDKKRSIPQNVVVDEKQITLLNARSKIPIQKKIFSVIFNKTFYRLLILDNKTLLKKLIKIKLYFQRFFNAVYISDFLDRNFEKNKGEIYYSYWLSSGTLALTLLKNKYPRIVAVSRAHGSDLYEEKNPLGMVAFQYAMVTYLDKIFVISKDGKEYLQKKYSKNLVPVVISRLGVRQNPFFSKRSKKPKEFVFLSCSSLSPVKRVGLIWQTLQKVKAQVRWVHIGGNPSLEQFEHEYGGLPSNIRVDFLGQLTNSEVHSYYLNNDVYFFINLSSSEGIPVSIMEAMSYSIPALATEVGGTKEIIQDGKNGILIPANLDVNEIAQKVESLCEIDSAEYLKFSANAYKTFEIEYNAAKNYNEFVNHLIKMVE